jgi:predicted GTPase
MPIARPLRCRAAEFPGRCGQTGIDDRKYPASLAGPRHPNGIPIRPEHELHDLIKGEWADEVVLAYSDLSHEAVMHKASTVLAAGADFTLLGPNATMLESEKPIVSVCAVRTGCGKSQTSRKVGQTLLDAGLKVALVRHPMPYGNLEAMRVQRFESIEEIDASDPTIEEREEYELPVEMGMIMYAGVDYEAILRQAAEEADVVVWDGGPTLTHGEMPFGAGLVAARNGGAATIVDPRPYAVGSIKETLERWPQLTNVLPAMGYDDEQLADLEATINAAECDVVVTGTPIDLGRLISSTHPIRHVRYELEEVGEPTLATVLEPIVARTAEPVAVH